MAQVLTVRTEASLLPEDFVVRGGSMPYRTMTSGARACNAQFGVYGISVAAGRGMTVQQLFQASRRLRLEEKFRLTTVGALLALDGVSMLPTFSAPHYTLVVPGAPTDDLWDDLTGVFGPVQPAPQWDP